MPAGKAGAAEQRPAPNSEPRGDEATTGRLRIVQVRSAIGSKPKHRGTLRALGLGRIGREVVLPDRPEMRGMLARVPHLVSWQAELAEVSAAEITARGSKEALP